MGAMHALPRDYDAPFDINPGTISPTANIDGKSLLLRSDMRQKSALNYNEYLLNSNEAILMIWRGAYITK